MLTDKLTAKIVGAFFLMALVADGIGSSLIESVMFMPDYLTQMSMHSARVIVGVLLGLLCGAAVIGISVIMFSIMKHYHESFALGYFAFRLTEVAIMMIILLCSLALLTLSNQHTNANAVQDNYFHTLGALLQAIRNWGYYIYIFVFSMGATLFYIALFKLKIIPRFICIWAFVGLAILCAGNLCNFFGNKFDMIFYGSIMGLNELFLGLWLLFKGFSTSKTMIE